MSKDEKDDLKFIADYYLTKCGAENQLNKLSEECGELIQIACKHNDVYVKYSNYSEEKLAEEIADVEILLYQVKYLLTIRNLVKEKKKEKIERQLERIKQYDEEEERFKQCQ